MHREEYRVLMVDDDPGDAGLVRVAFADTAVRCRLEHAPDGVEALRRLRDTSAATDGIHTRPDLILLDINMPRKTGHEVLAELKADVDLRGIPVVMLTTSDAERDIAAAYRAGAAGYITKPVDVDALFASVHGLVNYWFGLSRLPTHTAA